MADARVSVLIDIRSKMAQLDRATRAVGSALWTWQKPFRFTPLDGEDGAPGQNGLSVAQLTIYRRAASAPNTPTGGSYLFDNRTFVGMPSGWSATIPTGSDPLWAATSTAAIPGVSGIAGPLSWSTPAKIAENGQPINRAVVLYAYRRQDTAPATPTGGQYNFSTNTFTAPLNWSVEIPSGSLELWVSTAAATTITDGDIDGNLFWTAPRRWRDVILPDGSVDTTSVTADKINVDTLAAIKAQTGNLVVDGEVRSGVYAAGTAGWKIKSDGSAEFNQLSLRAGIITPGDILLHDPSVLLYSPNFDIAGDGAANSHSPNDPAMGWQTWFTGYDSDRKLHQSRCSTTGTVGASDGRYTIPGG